MGRRSAPTRRCGSWEPVRGGHQRVGRTYARHPCRVNAFLKIPRASRQRTSSSSSATRATTSTCAVEPERLDHPILRIGPRPAAASPLLLHGPLRRIDGLGGYAAQCETDLDYLISPTRTRNCLRSILDLARSVRFAFFGAVEGRLLHPVIERRRDVYGAVTVIVPGYTWDPRSRKQYPAAEEAHRPSVSGHGRQAIRRTSSRTRPEAATRTRRKRELSSSTGGTSSR